MAEHDKQQNNDELDDVSFESHNVSADDDISLEEEEALSAAHLKKIKDKLKDCEKERQEFLDSYQRLKADFVNQKKQFEADRNAFIQYAESGLINDLLPALSGFDAAMGNKEAWESAPSNWRVGIEYIHSLLIGALKKRNLEILDPLGKVFDPSLAEAVDQREVADKQQDNIVIAVVEKGYSLSGKVIKPARVIVGMFKQ